MIVTLTPDERVLARSALGLVYGRRASYRNYYRAGPVTHEVWLAMVGKGAAEPVGADGFRLTQAGANAALLPGDRLDVEDFPGRQS